MYCLDSNIVIENFSGNKQIESRLREIANHDVFITPVTLCELYKGAFLSNDLEKKVIMINNFLKAVNLLDFDTYSCELYGKIYSDLKKAGRLTQDFDLMIAAICKANNKILITRNKKHFENITELKLLGV